MARRLTDDRFKIFTLHIEGVNMDNVALEDIGGYLEDFALLLGKDTGPRYHSIKRGSLIFAAKVPVDYEVEVKTRGFLLRTGDAPEDATRARDRISQRAGRHRARKATLLDATKNKVIEFPIMRPMIEEMSIPTLPKTGSLQGKVIRVGGKKDVVTVDIEDVDGHVYSCRAKRDIARQLAKDMFEQTIRVTGTGRWHRTDDGWYVDDFQIASFEKLDDEPLITVVKELRSIPSAWKDLDDPLAALDKLRKGE